MHVVALVGILLVVAGFVVESSPIWTVGAILFLAGSIAWLWVRRN
ncbi:hypothetical protein [Pseudonocardia endophytica]|uniref:Uncharacterized protein n=1 Tax=Pseudonocardia endophytica TaxID=401976 RepID=A0A4R1I1R3_PSEEN|nr:hypothetical protein [Pseudonocardia endophytica]TCK27863.1 hypothetical protein EV378_3744 [Pseudonocardia endophytica]